MTDYSHHAVHYIALTFIFIPEEFVPFDPLHPFHPLPTPCPLAVTTQSLYL